MLIGFFNRVCCDDGDDDDDAAIGQSQSEPAVIVIDDPTLTSCQLSGLGAGRTYRVTVCARTRVGCGQPFTVDVHTPPAGRTSTLTINYSNIEYDFNVVYFPVVKSYMLTCKTGLDFVAGDYNLVSCWFCRKQ